METQQEGEVIAVLLVGNDGTTGDSGSGAGACIARTKRFRKAMEDAGLEVTVCSPPEGKQGAAMVRAMVREGNIDCIVAISPFPAECAVDSGISLPMWVDMNGMHPAELQMQNREDPRYGERMLRILALENSLLLRGDAFSAPSARQIYAVTGELLLLGRTDFNPEGGIILEPLPHSARGFEPVSPDTEKTFNVISTGSFNVWFDEETLFHGLEYAMSRDSRISFTSTGGSIPFSPAKYEGFRRMVSASPYRDRFDLRGWVSSRELEEVYASAAAAIYTDVRSPETALGARTRVLDWIDRGIPVVCTEGAEISRDIGRESLGIVVPQSDPVKLGEAILGLAADEGLRGRITDSQKTWCLAGGYSGRIFSKLTKWCKSPVVTSRGHLGERTVPRMNGLPYLSRLFVELSRSAGAGHALRRVFGRLISR